MTYSSIDLVSAYLGGVTIDDDSAVTSTELGGWLDWADAEINKITGSKFVTGTATNELYTFDGSGFLKLDKRPVISVTTLEYNNVPLGQGAESWVALSQGRTSSDDFILNKKYSGEILFHGDRPTTEENNVRVTYTYGYATTPPLVVELATALVAKNWLSAVLSKDANDSASDVSVGSISISSSSKGPALLMKTNERINELKQLVGVLDLRVIL